MGILRQYAIFISSSRKKSFIVLAGPSGCGKTTLLQLVAGFLTPDSGEIYIDDQLVNQKTPAQRNISMVFQEAALFPHMSVFENITFGLAHSGMRQQDIKEAVYQICEVLGICDLLERKARDLSGGQKQRCAIARALIRKPSLFLMDEPLSSLDARLKTQLRIEIAQLYQKNRIAIQGFETTDYPDSFFDCIIGNVPFGAYKVSDRRYDRHNFLIHDYFIAKSH